MLANGMTLASQNAVRLLGDAELLMKEGRHPSAVALAILAIEEAAKEDILCALATWPEEAETFWKSFRWHIDKNSLGFVPLLHDRARSPLEELIWLHEHSGERYFDEMKWSGLYVDLLAQDGQPYWWNPGAMSAEHAGFFLSIARRVVSPRTVSVAEVELMQRHVRPQEQATLADRDAGMRAYLTEAIRNGLRPFEPWMRDRFGVDEQRTP